MCPVFFCLQYDNTRPQSAPAPTPIINLGFADPGPGPDPRPKSTPSGMSMDSLSLSMSSSLEGAPGVNTSALMEGMSPSDPMRQPTPTPSIRSSLSTPDTSLQHSPGAHDGL